MAYRVTAPYATVKVNDEARKPTVYGFYEGALLPANADPDNVKVLLAKGMVQKVAEPEPVEKQEAEAKKADEAEAEPAAEKAAAKAAKA